MWQSTSDQGHSDETVKHTEIMKGGDLTINAAGGIEVDIKHAGSVEASIDILSQQPELAYLSELKNNPNIDWNKVNEAHQAWDYEQQGLTQAGAAIIAIAVTIATMGAGSGVGAGVMTASQAGFTLTGASAAAANAAMASLASQATISLANNQGDLGAVFRDIASDESLKQLAFAIVTAGVGDKIAGVTNGMVTTETTGLTGKSLEYAQKAASTTAGATVSATAQSAIYGDNLGETFVDRLKSGAINAIGAEVAGEIGQAYKHGEIDKATQLIAHAALGCGIGAASSDNCGAGAAGGVAGELTGEAYLKHKLKEGIAIDDIPQIQATGADLGQLAGAMAAALTGADGEGVYEGAGTGANAAQNNALDTIFDGLMILADSGKIAYGYYIDDEGIIEEGFVDLASDSAAFLIPFVPAGSSRLARTLEKGAEKAGVKLGKIGPKITSPDVVKSFKDGKYVNRQVDGNETFFKYHGKDNRTGKEYTFTTNKKYDNELDLRNDLAINEDWGIQIDRVTEFKLQKDTWISEGFTAPETSVSGKKYNGGGYQAVINTKNLPNSTIIRTDKAFK